MGYLEFGRDGPAAAKAMLCASCKGHKGRAHHYHQTKVRPDSSVPTRTECHHPCPECGGTLVSRWARARATA